LRSRPCGESWHEHFRGRSPVADPVEPGKPFVSFEDFVTCRQPRGMAATIAELIAMFSVGLTYKTLSERRSDDRDRTKPCLFGVIVDEAAIL
jgi:hypothetical protein